MRARLRLALFAVAFAAASCANANDQSSGGNGAIYDAWRAHVSRIEVTASGSVVRILGIRNGPSGAHEGFLVHLRGSSGRGLTIRVEDNVDLTGPIPLQEADDVVVRGEYIYDSRGGLVHYTHRDPRGRHPDGLCNRARHNIPMNEANAEFFTRVIYKLRSRSLY